VVPLHKGRLMKTKKPDYVEDVTHMHDTFELIEHIPSEPAFPDKALLRMRLNFLLEEFKELCASCGAEIVNTPTGVTVQLTKDPQSLSGALDAIVDLQVVLLGTADFFGFLGNGSLEAKDERIIFDVAWCRIMESNMRKIRDPFDKRPTAKFVKPEGWEHPDLSDLISIQ